MKSYPNDSQSHQNTGSQLRGSSEERLNFVLEAQGVLAGTVVGDHLALAINDELGEVPRDDLRLVRRLVVKRGVTSQESIHWVRFGPVDVNFGEEGELGTVFALGKCLDLSLCSRLLVAKLIARERKDFKPSSL